MSSYATGLNFYTNRKRIELMKAEIVALKAENAQLKQWKSEATQVLNDLDLSTVAHELRIPLGHSIADKILPAIRQNARLRESLREMSMCPDVSERVRILGRAMDVQR